MIATRAKGGTLVILHLYLPFFKSLLYLGCLEYFGVIKQSKSYLLIQTATDIEIPFISGLYPLVNKQFDPENHQFLMVSRIFQILSGRVYVNLPEGTILP